MFIKRAAIIPPCKLIFLLLFEQSFRAILRDKLAETRNQIFQ